MWVDDTVSVGEHVHVSRRVCFAFDFKRIDGPVYQFYVFERTYAGAFIAGFGQKRNIWNCERTLAGTQSCTRARMHARTRCALMMSECVNKQALEVRNN